MATYGHTFTSGDTVTPTKLNAARTVSDIVNADIKSDAAIAGTKIAPAFGGQDITVSTANRSITNTGNFALSFGTNNAERMRIDASGNVGIGTSSPEYKLDCRGGTASFLGTTGANAIRVAGAGGTWFWIDNPTTSTMRFSSGVTAGTGVMVLDSGGNVGIGTNSPTAKLDTRGDIVATDATNSVALRGSEGCVEITRTNGDPYIDFKSSGAEDFDCRIQQVSNGLAILAGGNGSSTEQMKIVSDGILFGTTSHLTVGVGSLDGIAYRTDLKLLSISRSENPPMRLRRRTNDGDILSFNRDTTQVGSISVTTTATAYNTSSDYRLKENPQPMVGALSRLADVKPVTFTWKSNGSQGEGFIAHELQEVIPDAVTGAKDAVDADGNPAYQGVDASKLVPILVAAVQELSAKVAALETAE